MRLPVAQYSVLDPRLITSTGSDSFDFSVPKLEFFNEWIKPSVQAKVVQTGNRVQIRTQKAEMDVSKLIASFNLDQRWFMVFEATLTWENDAGESEETLRGFGRMSGNGSESWGRSGMIHGRSRVDVWCEIAPEFSILRELLQNACNLALAALMRTLMPVFMTKLAEDYTKWASDENYRKEREMWELAPAN